MVVGSFNQKKKKEKSFFSDCNLSGIKPYICVATL